jgi:pantoate--beta-alanine ligase
MQVVTAIADVRRIHRSVTGSWGLVPTMGFLHAGHISLVRRARAENECAAVSIFVNPTQFGPNEDLARYPRDLDRDLDLLKREGVDVVLVPGVEEIYPKRFQTYVTVEEVTQGLEGAARLGHFRGVATVVCKLLNIFQPDRAYFGQKDAQQVVVIKQMVRDLAIETEIVVIDTVREPDGLALSSRNVYLSPDERRAATVLYRALCAAREAWRTGVREGYKLRAAMSAVLELEPLARIEYVSAADPETLKELGQARDRVLLSLAVRVGKTRLIDNFLL